MKQADKTIRVMLVDDHHTMLWGLTRLIETEAPRMKVAGIASTCEEAVERIRGIEPDVILLDLDLCGRNSIDILPDLLAAWPTRALVFTGGRNREMLDLAILRGARGILRKDGPAAHVIKAIEKIHQGELWLDHEALGRMVGNFLNPAATLGNEPEAQKQEALTDKERKIIQMLVEQGGLLNKALAQHLFISEHTLRNHLTSIYQKLELGNRLELYVYAVKHRLGQSRSDGKVSAPPARFAISMDRRSLKN